MTSIRRMTLLAIVLLAPGSSSCNEQNADAVALAPAITFPDAKSDGVTVPLDAVDGFPFRVQVCTPAPIRRCSWGHYRRTSGFRTRSAGGLSRRAPP